VRRLTLLLSLLVALAAAPAAWADVVTSQDHLGRTISFDVRAENVDLEWYAENLRTAAHGDEIERVRFLIVPAAELRERCGSGAAGCYRRGSDATITLPAGRSDGIQHTLYHEYGHHVDASRGVAAASREPNGSASWWEARDMTGLLAEGKVSHTYSLGWEKAIGEIFAEDYAQLHLETQFRIGWLDPPTEAVRAALRNDLENVPATPAPAAPRPPVIVNRRGVLRGTARAEIPFELLGPGRRVTVYARIGPARARVRMEIRCSDGRTWARRLDAARRQSTIDLRDVGPARCTASLRNIGPVAADFHLRVRLALPRAGV
jgi:hypothetical protein